MAKNVGPDQVRTIIESGHFDELIGAIEDQHLECKAALYQLQHEHQKQELAKDVCALANADGGIILIGVRTERNPAHSGDEITELCPFPQTLANPDQWYAVLRTWIYPPLQHVDIRWFPSAGDTTRGIVAIDIPTQPSAQRPFLVTRTIDHQGKRIEVVFGYIERRRAHAVPFSVEELQILMRDGLCYDLLNQQLEDIQQTLHALRAERDREVQLAARRSIDEFLRERIEQALQEVALQHQPAFIHGQLGRGRD
jgi:Putative DNA-binding domain